MLNIIEINKRRTAILSTLKNSPHTARLVEELAASHIEAIEQITEFITKYAYSKRPFRQVASFTEVGPRLVDGG